MSYITLHPDWQGKDITPESVFQNRREFLKLMGFSGAVMADLLNPLPVSAGKNWYDPFNWFSNDDALKKHFKSIRYYRRSTSFTVYRPQTQEEIALKYNNFYEFADSKDVWKRMDRFKTAPWQVEVAGYIKNPRSYDPDDLGRHFGLEERIYRHRCVEAWAMVVPWIGFPLSALIKRAEPTGKAKYIRFVSFNDPSSAPGQGAGDLPWPYTEGLTIEEGMNELAFLATGLYGHVLPHQHGAPIRLVVPWKYGFKSIKSITRIEFVEERPSTFWNTLVPHEYDFEANVNPDLPHPRWSQKREKMIGTGDVYRTEKYNGYGRWVSGLYS